MSVLAITDANFDQEVMKSDLPVLIDFYADWCQPCKRIAPIMAQLSDEYAGTIKVVKVNTEHARQAAGKFQVRSIPLVVLVKGGVVVDKIVGALPKAKFVAMIEKVIAKPKEEVKATAKAKAKAAAELWGVDRLKTAAEIDMAVPIDVRDKATFEVGHIPHAIHAPTESRAKVVAALKEDAFMTYVVYGEGAAATATAIIAAGHNAAILDGGMAAWRARHLLVEKG